MEREFVFTMLSLAVCGPVMLLAGALTGRSAASLGSARDLERTTWVRLLLPFLIASIAFSALVGWWAPEPDDSEALPWSVLATAGIIAVVWARALVRAAWALRPVSPLAGTAGVLRPRVLISAEYCRTVGGEVLHAAREHEEAHVRHRDPLRIWVAQLLTDMQWPLRSAARRMGAWREALELARDEEARERGVDGADLATAVLQAMRLQQRSISSVAALGDQVEALQRRIARLLEPLPVSQLRRRRSAAGLALFLACTCAAACAGATQGEALVRSLIAP